MNVAIIGGTGKLGRGLVARLLESSHTAVIGSREVSKAQNAASKFEKSVGAMTNGDAAAWCDLAVVTVPYSAHRATLAPLKDALQSKVVIDATVPIDFQNLYRVVTESGNSAAEETNALLSGAFVFAAFQTISFRVLRRKDLLEDVLVAGGSERKDTVLQFIRDLNLRPFDAGQLAAAILLERMTALLISMNKQNNLSDLGLKVTGA